MKLIASALALLVLSTLAHAALPVTPAKDQKALLASSDPKLAANKKLVYDMWRTVLVASDIDAADKFIAPEYMQHNPNAETGLAGMKAFFKSLNRPKKPLPDTIEGLVAIVAEGDLVTMSFVREYKDKEGKPYTTTWFDMFRIANGKIVEHWDSAMKM